MPRLPPNRLDELLALYGGVRNCPLDEMAPRRKIYRAALLKAADDDAAAISSDEIGDAVADLWEGKNKLKRPDAQR